MNVRIWCIIAALVTLVAVICVDMRWRTVERDELYEYARMQGYAEALFDVSMEIAQGGGVDEVLAFAKKRAAEDFSRRSNKLPNH